MYTYFKTGTHTCMCAQVASVRFQHADKKLGYIKHGIVTVYACTVNVFLNLITMYLFSNNNKAAINHDSFHSEISAELPQLGFSLTLSITKPT